MARSSGRSLNGGHAHKRCKIYYTHLLIIDTRNYNYKPFPVYRLYSCTCRNFLQTYTFGSCLERKRKPQVELDDRNVATLALLGLRQMNGQAANKKQKGRATPQRSKRVSPVARRQRKPKVIKTPQKKRPSPSARQQRKKKRADMLTTSSATKKPRRHQRQQRVRGK